MGVSKDITVQENPKGRFLVTIPRVIADSWGIKKGQTLTIEADDECIYIRRPTGIPKQEDPQFVDENLPWNRRDILGDDNDESWL